jgi:eukaryotic-like serine/threonine-protein kinase
MNAFDPFTGDLLWQTVLDKPIATVTTPFGGDCLYKIDSNHLMALTNVGGIMFDASNGKILWYDTDIIPNAVYHPGLYDENTKMFFGPKSIGDENNQGVRFYIDYGWDLSNPDLNKGNGGRLVWSRVRNYPGNPMLCAGEGLVFMGSYQSAMVYALNQTNGNLVWQTTRYDAAGYAGVYGEGRLVVGCQSQWIICYNATDGKILWENNEGTANRAFNVWNGLIAYGRTYWHDLGAGLTGATKCLDLKTGKTLWRAVTTEYIGYYQTCVADGKIYGMLSDNSTTTGRESIAQTFACWDAYTGAVIWKINPRAAIAWPIVAFGCLYFVFDNVAYCISTATAPVNWPMWRGNVENPGIALGTGPLDLSIGPKWTFTTGASIGSSPAVVNGKVYINSGDRNVYCLDAYSGSMLWKFQTAQPLMTTFDTTPAVIGNKVIIGPDDGYVYCLDATTGAKIWSVQTGEWKMIQSGSGQFQTRSSPIIYNNNIYVASAFDNKTYCIDLNGNIKWTYQTSTPVLGSVAIEDNKIYFLSTSGNYKVINTNNITMGTAFQLDLSGNLIKSWPIQSLVFAGSFRAAYASMQTPVVVSDKMFVGVNGGFGICYNVTTGALIWAQEDPYVLAERSQGSPVYVPYTFVRPANATNGNFFGDTKGIMICNAGPTMAAQRADNGSNLWSAWGGWEVFSSPVFAGISQSSRIYSGSESYGMTSWDAATGRPMSWFTTNGGLTGSVAIYDGKLYFGSTDNKVYCFEDHVKQLTTLTATVDKTQIATGDSITAQVTLTRPQLEGEASILLNPALPTAKVTVSFISPNNVESKIATTTDNMGLATATFTPNEAGAWKVIASYDGENKPTTSYNYAFSDQISIQVGTSATATPTPATATPTPATPTPTPATATPTASPTPSTDNTTTYVIVIVAVVVIVVITAAYMLMKRKK